jgi:hypothetical protein
MRRRLVFQPFTISELACEKLGVGVGPRQLAKRVLFGVISSECQQHSLVLHSQVATQKTKGLFLTKIREEQDTDLA